MLQQMPVITSGNKEQQKKYLGRLIDEPLVAVSFLNYKDALINNVFFVRYSN